MIKKFTFLFILFFAASPSLLRASEQDSTRLFSILDKSNHSYEAVKSYSALFEKQERSHGKLAEKEKIFLQFEKPFKIFMNWLNTEKKDLQVVYERGRHQGKLAIHKPGLGLGLLPVIFLDQNSPWVKEGSETYNIEDAGIGTFLTDFTKAVDKARAVKQLQVNFPKSQSPEDALTAEVVFRGSNENSGYFAYRILVKFDSKTDLPTEMQLFDWNDELTGTYAYENLKINLPADNAELKQQMNHQLYRVYQGK